MAKIVLWDFDETLAERPGRWWGCMLEIIGRRHPDRAADERALRQALGQFYPWRFPEVVHEHLNDPDDWWAALQPGLAIAAVAAGLDPRDADAVAAEVRSCYPTAKAFRLYDDTTEALRMFRDAGWRQAIVSNHCPELESLVDSLGIGRRLTVPVHDSLVTRPASPAGGSSRCDRARDRCCGFSRAFRPRRTA